MKRIPTTPAHEAFYHEACALLKKHVGNLSAEDLLALTAQLVGHTIAFQDMRTTSRERALEIVMANIESGNAHAIAEQQKLDGVQ